MILEIDDETANVLNELVEQQHISPAQLIKNALTEYLEDIQDAKCGEEAYQRYLDGGKVSHDLNRMVKELGLYTMIYWKNERLWLGKLLEHPEIMTQGESLEELEENIKDAYLTMAMDDVPADYQMKEIALASIPA